MRKNYALMESGWIPGHLDAFKPNAVGKICLYDMGGGGGPSETTTYTTNLPEYAEPYYGRMVERAEALSQEGYQPYTSERIAGFTPEQQATFSETLGMQTPGQFGNATAATQAGINAALGTNYTPGEFTYGQVSPDQLTQYQMTGPAGVSGMQQTAPEMQAAQTQYRPELEYFQMEGPERFGAQQLSQYMSPFQQAITDVAKRNAALEAQKIQMASNLGAARTGTYGGARQTLAQTEREKALMQNLSDIQIRGSQAAFENAQQQFERDRAAQMATGRENLAARLGVQQLGASQNLQVALANLDKAQQAAVQNQAAQLQTQGLNADQALRAALANQQAQLTTEQQNLAARLGVQQLGATQSLEAQRANQAAMMEAQKAAEQSRQFGQTTGLEGLRLGMAGAQQLAGIGAQEQAANLARLQAQQATANVGQQMEQRRLDQAYQDFLAQREFPYRQLEFYNAMLRGLPTQANTTSSQYQAQPNLAQQVLGYGIPALALSKAFSAS